MATGAVNDLEDLTGELDAAEESLASIKFEFTGGTFSFTAVAISNVSVSFGGASTSGPSIAIEQGTMIYNDGIDGKGGALLNFSYLGVDNIVAQNAVFSGSVAVTGGISANGSAVVTAKDLEGMAKSIDQTFKSLAEALTTMCGAIKTAIEGVRKALETSNAAINKANAAIKKANTAINKANKAIKAVDEIARKAFCEVSLKMANGTTDGSVALNLTFTNKDGETVDRSGIFSAASSSHSHQMNVNITSSGMIEVTAADVKGSAFKGSGDASGVFVLKKDFEDLKDQFNAHKHDYTMPTGSGKASVSVDVSVSVDPESGSGSGSGGGGGSVTVYTQPGTTSTPTS